MSIILNYFVGLAQWLITWIAVITDLHINCDHTWVGYGKGGVKGLGNI